MNRVSGALTELEAMDDLAAGQSPVHRLHPLVKLITTVAFIAAVVSYGKYELSGLAGMLLYTVLMYQLSGIPMRLCFKKMRFMLPLVLAVGIFNPILDRASALWIGPVAISGGVLSMLTLALKGALCLSASFLLAATTRIDSLCAALRQLRVPAALVTLLLLTCRYVGVMVREVAVMTEAYQLRAPGQRGVHRSAWGSFLGQLLLRSMDRAEELYASMQLRGFRGEFFYAAPSPFSARDALWLAGCAGALVALRCFDVARLLGGALIK